MKEPKHFSDLKQITQDTIESYRKIWEKTAKENGWYKEPFYLQVWINSDQDVMDAVAHKGLTEDILFIDDGYDENWD